MALAAYRHLLRATRIAFHEDHPLLHAARAQARVGFDKQSSLDPTSPEAVKAIEHAEGVATILRHNIVQGVQAEGDDKLSSCFVVFINVKINH
jgi:complex III assembly factor LYRM7